MKKLSANLRFGLKRATREPAFWAGSYFQKSLGGLEKHQRNVSPACAGILIQCKLAFCAGIDSVGVYDVSIHIMYGFAGTEFASAITHRIPGKLMRAAKHIGLSVCIVCADLCFVLDCPIEIIGALNVARVSVLLECINRTELHLVEKELEERHVLL